MRVEVPARWGPVLFPYGAAFVAMLAAALGLLPFAHGNELLLAIVLSLAIFGCPFTAIYTLEAHSRGRARTIEVRADSVEMGRAGRTEVFGVEDIHLVDLEWERVTGDPIEGLKGLGLWLEGSREVTVSLVGIDPPDVRRLWDALVRLVRAHDLTVDDDMTRFLKYCWAGGHLTGMEGHPTLTYVRKLAVPPETGGGPLLRSDAAWKRRYFLDEWGMPALVQAITLPLIALAVDIWLMRYFSLPAPVSGAVALAFAGAAASLMAFQAWTRAEDLMPGGDVPGLREGGVQLTWGDGLVPWPEMAKLTLVEWPFLGKPRIGLELRYDPASGLAEDDDDMGQDRVALLRVRPLGRDGVAELMARVGPSRVDQELRKWWEARR